MQLIPAIDLQQGRPVRLKQGKFQDVTFYDKDPLDLACQYVEQGAERLHIVDLDGARAGMPQHLDLLAEIGKISHLSIQAGGGIRSLESLSTLKDKVTQVVLGSVAVNDQALTKEMLKIVSPDSVVLALDVVVNKEGQPQLATHGWQTISETLLWDLVRYYRKLGISTVLCTDIAKDGMMQGPNFQLYQEAVQRFPDIRWQASGGIRNAFDIDVLASFGVSGVILGRMLYESDFSISAYTKEKKNAG